MYVLFHAANSVTVTIGVAGANGVAAIIFLLTIILCVLYFFMKTRHRKSAILGNLICYNIYLHVLYHYNNYCVFIRSSH